MVRGTIASFNLMWYRVQYLDKSRDRKCLIIVKTNFLNKSNFDFWK